MSEKRYYCDDDLEYRDYCIFDLSKADKTMDDFRDEDDMVTYKWHEYLIDNDAAMLGQEVEKALNEQDTKIQRLEKENEMLREHIQLYGSITNLITEYDLSPKEIKEILDDYTKDKEVKGHRFDEYD